MKCVVAVVCGVACACSAPKKAAPADGPPVDSRPADAPAIDAAFDAPIDAVPIDSSFTSPACTTTPALLFDASPRQLSNMAMADGVLYVGVYDGSSADVVALDPATGSAVGSAVPVNGMPVVWSDGARVFAAGDAGGGSGVIWRLHPDGPPEAVVTGRTYPSAIAADATSIYWGDEPGLNTYAVEKQPLAGGSATALTNLCSEPQPQSLFVDDTNLYCASFENPSAIIRMPTSGSGTAAELGCGASYPIFASTRDGSDIYFIEANPMAVLWQVALPDGACTQIQQSSTYGRVTALAATADDFYEADYDAGIWRISRDTLVRQLIVSTIGAGQSLFVWQGQLFFQEPNPVDPGQEYIMHCVD